MHRFEDILEDSSEQCGWNDSTKYTLLLDFLEKHCIDKLDEFEEVMESIVVDELSGNY